MDSHVSSSAFGFLFEWPGMLACTVFFVIAHWLLERSTIRAPWIAPIQFCYSVFYAILRFFPRPPQPPPPPDLHSSGVGGIYWTYLLHVEGWLKGIWNEGEGRWDPQYLFCSCLPVRSSPSVEFFLKLYYLSKAAEFLDIVGCILRNIPLHPHFRIHHCTFFGLFRPTPHNQP